LIKVELNLTKSIPNATKQIILERTVSSQKGTNSDGMNSENVPAQAKN
jgi:hypothetical protein